MKNKYFDILMKNRFMRSEQEIFSFESALENLAANSDESLLPELHLALEDECSQTEVMYGLIHYLESFDITKQLRAFLKVLPELYEKSPEWVKILYYGILNDNEARKIYKNLINESEGKEKKIAIKIIQSIAINEKGDLKLYAESFLI